MKYLIGAFLLSIAPLLFAGHHEKEAPSPNILATKAAYEAFSAGDLEAWRAVHSEEVVWTILEGLPYAGTHVGPDNIIKNVFEQISELWPDFQVKPIAYYEVGDKVFVHVKITIGGKQTEAVHMATLKDGKQVAFTPFENSSFMMQQLD
jgi:ketosteroid isomerase-like protein